MAAEFVSKLTHWQFLAGWVNSIRYYLKVSFEGNVEMQRYASSVTSAESWTGYMSGILTAGNHDVCISGDSVIALFSNDGKQTGRAQY